VASTPTILYKYAALDTAKEIINNQTLRWLAPTALPEPFAVNTARSMMIKDEVLTDALAKFVASMIFAHSLPFKDTTNPIVKAIIRWRSSDRFGDEEEARTVLSDLLQSTVLKQQEKNQEMLEHWDYYLDHLRMLCLGDKPDNIALWDSHAGRHQGVAFGIEVDASNDDAAPKSPEKLKYGEQRPVLTDMRAQIEDILGLKRLEPKEMFTGQFLIKPKCYLAEQEWRSLRVLNEAQVSQSDTKAHSDFNFMPSSVKRAYLGAAMDSESRIEMINLIKEKLPETDIYSCTANMTQFTLKTEKIHSA
jgi:hypothetical protein